MVAATLQVSIDPNGNLTSDGTKTFQWDANNKPITVKQGGSTLASVTYDGSGRRASKTAGSVTITYAYDRGTQFLEERSSVGATARYVDGPGTDRPLAQVVSGTASYNVADHLGSVVRTTDSAGTPTLTREYDSWGNPLQGSSTGGYAYTGREWDLETGLYYYRARYYAAGTGRFISDDPSGLEGGLNLYAYVQNRPTISVDPSGLKTQICCRSLTWTSLANHCFVVISGNPNVSGGRLTTYSLVPTFAWWTTLSPTTWWGIPRRNYPEDRSAFLGGQIRGCYPVASDCAKEQKIDENWWDAGPSRYYNLAGPNNNTYTRYQTKKAGCEPPAHIPNAPGYEYPLGF